MKLLKLVLKFIAFIFLAILAGLGLFLAALWVENKSTLTLPAPTGNFAVSRVLYDWVDPTRRDVLADQPGLPRELAVCVWYPAESGAAAEPAPYLPLNWVQGRDNDQGIGRLVEYEFTGIRTHSYNSLPLPKAQAGLIFLV
ncbi:MAG: hypothetical protein ABSE06_16420 [Anaerolineaceae bacterium]|jgi:predicted dienelactone hydrolase